MGTTYLESDLLWKLLVMREEVLYKVFLDLRKAYDALDQEIFMKILVECEVGPRTERILRYYWYHISMVARVGSYYFTSSIPHHL